MDEVEEIIQEALSECEALSLSHPDPHTKEWENEQGVKTVRRLTPDIKRHILLPAPVSEWDVFWEHGILTGEGKRNV